MKSPNPHNSSLNDAASLASHSIKSVPSVVEVINILLTGESLHHQDIIKEHNGQQHRLGITIHRLRKRYRFGKIIQCPRGNHPLKNRYFIQQSDLDEAWQIAEREGLVNGYSSS